MCSMCRRQVGLWNYTRDDNRGTEGSLPYSTQKNDEDSDQGSEEPSAKKRRTKVRLKI